MKLDDETLRLLGWGSERTDFDDRLTPTRLGGNPSRIVSGDIDGRSKRNWRHKQRSCKRDATTGTTQFHSQSESP